MAEWWGRAYDRLLDSLQTRHDRRQRELRQAQITKNREAVAIGRYEEARMSLQAALAADRKARKRLGEITAT